MVFDYAPLAAEAAALIADMGRTVTVRKKSRTPADASEPWRAPTSSPTEASVIAVVVPFEAAEVDGTLIRRTDKQAYVAANDASPHLLETFDELEDGGDVLKIHRASVINPGATRLLYHLHLRG